MNTNLNVNAIIEGSIPLSALSSDIKTSYNLALNAVQREEYNSDQEGVAASLTDLANKVNEKSDTKVSGIQTSSLNSGTSMYILGHGVSGTSTTAAFKTGLYMKGMASATTVHGAIGYYQDSDERLKTFRGEIPLDLEKLRKLPKAYFTWNGDEEGKMQIGTSAQKVRELYPEIVSGSDDTRLDVDYTKLAVIALRGIDVLYDEMEKTRSEMETMKSELDVIKQKLGI